MSNHDDYNPNVARTNVRILAVGVNCTVTRVTGPSFRDAGPAELDSKLFAPRQIDMKGDVLLGPSFGVESPPNKLELGDAGRVQRERNGLELLSEVREACKEDGRHSRLRVLIDLFPAITLRVTEVHALLNSLPEQEVQTLLGKRRGPGRPSESRVQVARVRAMDHIQEADGGSTAEAARRVSAAGVHPSPRTLQNLAGPKAEYRRYVRFLTEGLFILEGELTPLEWGAPETMTATIYVTDEET